MVLVGILGAITVEGWRDEWNDRKNEYVLLLQLQEDFKTNQQLIEKGVEGHQLQLRILQLTLNHTGPDVVMPEQEVQDSLVLISYASVELVYSTINPFLSSGQIELLKSDRLKAHLSSFPGTSSIYKGFEILSKDIAIQQRHLHQSYVAILSMDWTKQSKVQTPHKSDVLGLLRDRDYQNTVVNRIYQTRNAVNALTNLNESNEYILELLNKELTRFDMKK